MSFLRYATKNNFMKENPFEVPRRELEYVDEFKEVVHSHPGIIDLFKRIREKSKQEIPNDGFWEENDIIVTPIDYKGEFLLDESGGDYFKVKVDNNDYFVKCKRGYHRGKIGSGGVDEANSLNLAREMIKGIANVDVVDFQLGYQDEKTQTSYFVSKWMGGVNLSHFLGRKDADIPADEIDAWPKLKKELRDRTYAIYKAIGENFRDVANNNMMYDPVSGKITIFDIHYIDPSRENE